MPHKEAVWKIRDRYFSIEDHPYPIFEQRVMDRVASNSTVLELGCGRSGGLLSTLKGKAGRLIGIDQGDYHLEDDLITYFNNNIENMRNIGSNMIDFAYSRSVMEHIQDIDAAYSEIYRVLKGNGCYLFLTPNIFDYASVASFVIPNRFHANIVHALEGRDKDDTFPVYYKSNSRRRICKLAERHGFSMEQFQYLGQYPSYFSFNKHLFLLGCKYEHFLRNHPQLWFLRGWILCTLRKT